MRQIMAMIPVLFAVLVALSVGGSFSRAAVLTGAAAALQGNDVAAVDEALKQAFRSGDPEALERLYAADAVLISPFGVFHGAGEIRGYIERFFQQNPGLEVTFGETTAVLNTAVHRAHVTSEPIRTSGVDRITLIHTVVVERQRIVSLTAAWDLSDAETARFLAASTGTPPPSTPTS